MQLITDRFAHSSTHTLGRLMQRYDQSVPYGYKTYIDKFWCFTLEDPWQATKIQGNTRIPAGKYEIVLRPEGGKYRQYLDRFGEWQKPGMLWIKDVPGFDWILIHPGNTPKDTEGCLLVGRGYDYRNGSITDSVDAYVDIYSKISKALQAGEKVTIEYQDNDR